MSAGREPGPLAPAYRQITLAVLALITIVAFEAMAVSTAMPVVAADLGAVRGYGLAFSSMLTAQLLGIVVAGVWADRSGPMASMLTGQVLVAVGSTVCGLAQKYPAFVAGRVVTGLGGGLLVVLLYVIAARIYPESVRPRLFSLVSAAWVLPSLAGPSVSAWLTQTWSWRLVFLVVVPPTLATLAFFVLARDRFAGGGPLPGDDADRVGDIRRHRATAWAGMALALSAGAVQFGTAGTEHAAGWAVAAVGVLGVIATAPRLTPRGTWRMAHGVPSVMLSRALLSAAFGAGIAYVPLLVVSEYDQSLLTAGALVAAGSLGWAGAAWWQGHTSLRMSRHQLVVAGGTLLALGMAGIGLVTFTHLPWPLLAIPLVLNGVAMGLGTTTTSLLALSMVSASEHARSSSAIQLADVLGGVLGIAAATAAFSTWHSESGDRLVLAALFVAIAAVAVVVVPSGHRIRT